MGGDEITNSFREELQQGMSDFQASVEAMLTSYTESVAFYFNLMQEMFNKVASYAKQNELIEMHEYCKAEAFKQVRI